MDESKALAVLTVKERLEQFGYMAIDKDEGAIGWALGKASAYVCNECNTETVPDSLFFVCADIAVGEFLQMKKTFAPDDLAGLDLSNVVTQISEGDTTVQFASGGSAATPEQRLDALIARLLSSGSNQFSCFRRLRW